MYPGKITDTFNFRCEKNIPYLLCHEVSVHRYGHSIAVLYSGERTRQACFFKGRENGLCSERILFG